MANLIAEISGGVIKDTINAVGDQINKKIELQTQSDSQQIQINNIEAANNNLFISGWRPFCGWICSLALAYHAILQPFILFIFAIFGKTIQLPTFDNQTLTTVLFGLLGLTTARTIEKLKK